MEEVEEAKKAINDAISGCTVSEAIERVEELQSFLETVFEGLENDKANGVE